jgi:hypothetical protein
MEDQQVYPSEEGELFFRRTERILLRKESSFSEELNAYTSEERSFFSVDQVLKDSAIKAQRVVSWHNGKNFRYQEVFR